jgi:hypothetical protein
MDYSEADEHPEASPWATSPQPTRTSFEAPESPEFAPSDIHQSQPDYTQDSHVSQSSDQQEPPQSLPAAEAPVANNAQPKTSPQKRKDRPHYKLQAKITSLERNGRKDPILKFDVYVSDYPWNAMLKLIFVIIDKST